MGKGSKLVILEFPLLGTHWCHTLLFVYFGFIQIHGKLKLFVKKGSLIALK